MKEQYKQDFIKAGAIAREVRAFGRSLIAPGASYNAVIQQIYQKIQELGAIPAFPPQIALNDVAAHFLPQPGTDIIFSNQLIKLDVGICFNGAIGDCACTIDLSGKYGKIIEAAEAALLNAEQIIKVGLPIREIGKIIESTIVSYGLKPVKNLCGHGLGFYKIHTAPSIPNCDDKSTGVIKPGMTFAIEPFATNGKGLIYEATNPTLFSFEKARPVQSGYAKALLPKIETFKGLPFSFHNLIEDLYRNNLKDREFGKEALQNFNAERATIAERQGASEHQNSEAKPTQPKTDSSGCFGTSLIETKLGLNELMALGVIVGYPPLVEEAHGMVAQAENSVLVDQNGQVFITTR